MEPINLPYMVKRDLRDAVVIDTQNRNHALFGLPETRKICDREQLDINSNDIQRLIADQIKITEHEMFPWWEEKPE